MFVCVRYPENEKNHCHIRAHAIFHKFGGIQLNKNSNGDDNDDDDDEL